jgi:hypothetical protein
MTNLIRQHVARPCNRYRQQGAVLKVQAKRYKVKIGNLPVYWLGLAIHQGAE